MIKLKDKYYIKIVPMRGDKVHRFEVTRRRIIGALAGLTLAMIGILGFTGFQVARAHFEEANLQSQASQQSAALQQIDRQTDQLRRQLQQIQRQNQQIQQLIGVHAPKPHPAVQNTSWVRTDASGIGSVEEHLDQLSAASAATTEQADTIRTLTFHVLNLRHVANLARARAIAEIPSIDPVDGAQIVGCFCYRTSPSVEFHEGVDLGADYGQTVRATAAGVVSFAGWDGSYGEKIVIDHGNGYQTWYAHLSRIDVTQGQNVFKSEPIALVGDTGFSTGPHLHYQVMHDGQAIDPAPFLSGVPSNVLASLP